MATPAAAARSNGVVMAHHAILRYAHISPTKAQPVMSLIRGKPVSTALDLLRASPKRAAYMIDKVLRSAMANAEQNGNVDVDDLVVVKAAADTGSNRIKRWRPGARGRGGPYIKRMSHLFVEVDVIKPQED